MKAVVVASGDVDSGDLRLLDDAELVVAADGGASSIVAAGRRPDLVVGDLDSTEPSLVERLERAGVGVERHSTDKEASDTELALFAALAAGATSVVLLGATGGARLDHELANVLLLTDPALDGVDVRLVRGGSVLRALRGGEAATLDGAPGSLVTLLAVGPAEGVTTVGMRWRLDGAALRPGASRGLSNEIVAAPASVRIERGTLLVVETPATGRQRGVT